MVGGGYSIAIAIHRIMRDKHYKPRAIRISDEVYKELQSLREENNLSWNLLLKKLIEKYAKRSL